MKPAALIASVIPRAFVFPAPRAAAVVATRSHMGARAAETAAEAKRARKAAKRLADAERTAAGRAR